MKKSRLLYALPPIITMMLYSVILAVKGIYPFGVKTIDYYDMAQQIAPFYYHVYDALHGTKSFFYDWYTALGTNMAMSTSGCSNLSLFNLFFWFIRRSSLLKSLSVFNGIKLVCMSFTMFIYLHRTHNRAPLFFQIISAVAYSFSGFVLVLYITNQWMDIAVLFPLIMYFYDRMIDEGKMAGYVIVLSLALIASYYLGFMILIFLFLYTGLVMSVDRFGKDEDGYKKISKALPLIGIGTLLALALSSFILVPQLTQMLSSARFANGNAEAADGVLGKYAEILSHVRGDYTTRWWTLLLTSFPTAVILTGLIRDIREHRDRSDTILTVSLILLAVLELFVESINLMWHFGSYVQYPIRNGFIISFVFGYLCCFYGAKLFGSTDETPDTIRNLNRGFFSFAATVVGFPLFIVLYMLYVPHVLRSVFHLTSTIMAVMLIIYILLLYGSIEREGKPRKNRFGWAVGLIALEILCYGFLLFGKPDFVTGYSEEPEQNGDFIGICERLRETILPDNEYAYRIKNPDESLNANYGLVLARPALSNWTHMIAPDEQSGAAKWGYSVQFTRLLDAGGTVFSDALIGIRDVITSVPADEGLYQAVKKVDGYTLYKPKYTLPFGIVISGDDITDVPADIVDLHNHIFRSMSIGETGPAGKDVARAFVRKGVPADQSVSVNDTINGNERTVDITFPVDEETVIYLNGPTLDSEYANSTISISDDESTNDHLLIPTIGDPYNIYYPAHFNNNAVCLGRYKDDEVHIRVSIDTEKGRSFDVNVFGLSVPVLDEYCQRSEWKEDDTVSVGKSTVDIIRNVADDARNGRSYLMLPVTYDRGWNISVNGKEAPAGSFAGLFTLIELENGENKVHMEFTPPGMHTGIAVSISSIAIILAYVIMLKINKDRTDTIIGKITTAVAPFIAKVYLFVFAAAVMVMYVIPVLYAVCYYARRIIS